MPADMKLTTVDWETTSTLLAGTLEGQPSAFSSTSALDTLSPDTSPNLANEKSYEGDGEGGCEAPPVGEEEEEEDSGWRLVWGSSQFSSGTRELLLRDVEEGDERENGEGQRAVIGHAVGCVLFEDVGVDGKGVRVSWQRCVGAGRDMSEVLRTYMGPRARRLELFAEHAAGLTSGGNEVLKFQHAAYHHLSSASGPRTLPVARRICDRAQIQASPTQRHHRPLLHSTDLPPS
ncbi:unnamed protein product [Arctogadus glacialis]